MKVIPHIHNGVLYASKCPAPRGPGKDYPIEMDEDIWEQWESQLLKVDNEYTISLNGSKVLIYINTILRWLKSTDSIEKQLKDIVKL